MGLFTKKHAVCKGCGKEFTYRSKTLFDGFCLDCQTERYEELEQLKAVAAGYLYYDESYLWNNNYSNEDLKAMIAHRSEVLANNDISMNIDVEASIKDYVARLANLSAEEKKAAIDLVHSGTYKSTGGVVIAGYAMAPSTYPGVLVDARDVFAVCYEEEAIPSISDRFIKITVLTNDPYVPVFTYCKYIELSAIAKISFIGERKQKKKEIEEIAEELQKFYPNLKYPVVKNSEMKKLIKKSGNINANMTKEKALDCLSKSYIYGGYLKTELTMPCITKEMFESAGYVSLEDANEWIPNIYEFLY